MDHRNITKENNNNGARIYKQNKGECDVEARLTGKKKGIVRGERNEKSWGVTMINTYFYKLNIHEMKSGKVILCIINICQQKLEKLKSMNGFALL